MRSAIHCLIGSAATRSNVTTAVTVSASAATSAQPSCRGGQPRRRTHTPTHGPTTSGSSRCIDRPSTAAHGHGPPWLRPASATNASTSSSTGAHASVRPRAHGALNTG